MAINIQIKWLSEIQKQYWSWIVNEYLNRWIKKSVLALEREMKIETPVDRGILRSAYQSQFFDLKWILLNPTQYALYVNDWTRPHTPPFQVISDRANRHWMNPWAVRMSIKKKGTKANPYLDRAIDKTEDIIDDIFDKTLNDLVSKFNDPWA